MFMATRDTRNFYIHPIFSDIESTFRFFLLSIGVLGQKDLQAVVVSCWPNISVGTTAAFEGFAGLTIDTKLTIEQFNKTFSVAHRDGKTTLNIDPLLKTQARLMAVYMYETICQSEYKGAVPEELNNFLYHIRNAAAHDNVIKRFKKSEKVASWREKTIDEATENKEVFNSFVNAADIIALMIDLSDIFKRIDITRSKATVS